MKSADETLSNCALGSTPGTPAGLTVEELTYALSHDLRGPLVNLQGFLRRLHTGCEGLEAQAEGWELSANQRREWQRLLEQKVWSSLFVLERNARRLDRLVTALLDLSRAGRDPVHMGPVATADVIRAVIEELGPSARDLGATLIIDPLPDLWADPSRIEQIFRELLTNALKFLAAERPGQIRIGGAANGAEATCWVQDNGIGVRAEYQQRIFLPFGKIRQVEAPGEGVGLAIVLKLIRQQGGRLWVESIPGEGSRFFLALPARNS